MGFKAPRKTYKLVFADPDLEGLIVRTGSASTRQALDAQDMAGSIQEADATDSDAAKAKIQALLEMFVSFIVEWNLEDDNDQPMPVTVESLMAQDLSFTMTLIYAWVAAVTDVPAPLEPSSTPGPPVAEASLPMETLSPSLAS